MFIPSILKQAEPVTYYKCYTIAPFPSVHILVFSTRKIEKIETKILELDESTTQTLKPTLKLRANGQFQICFDKLKIEHLLRANYIIIATLPEPSLYRSAVPGANENLKLRPCSQLKASAFRNNK
jgi:hypothetical protein